MSRCMYVAAQVQALVLTMLKCLLVFISTTGSFKHLGHKNSVTYPESNLGDIKSLNAAKITFERSL